MLDLRLEYKYMKKDIDSAIKKCLDHQKWIFGPEVKDLEDKVAGYLGVKHCIGSSSGTEALVLSLRALAIKLKGQEFFDKTDEILTTPFTFTATGDAILRAGATPVFVDIDPLTYNIDTAKIRECLNSSLTSKVIGILPVHLYGQSCNMDEIMDIAEQHKLFVIEDVAQAFGAAWKDKKLGSIGTTGSFSFFPSKNLGAFGDAGMVSTNDDKIANLVRMLIKHGGKDKYNVDHIGYNARLDTLQAAIIAAKLKYVDEFNERRSKIAGFYDNALRNLNDISPPMSLPAAHHVYHQYTIRLKNGKRDDLQRFLSDQNIGSMVYYPVPLHKMRVFDERHKSFLPMNESEKAVTEVLSLPIEPLMKDKDVMRVAKSVKLFFA
jgi:dTDP-4-amino-4,6-dideoxygalactose transaminase